jgi:threonine dehydratase
LEAGRPIEAAAGGIAADSLAPKQVVARVVLVPDDTIRASQQMLWDTLRVVTEPGGAAAFAALLSGQNKPGVGERVGVLLCGSNTTAVNFGDGSDH